MQSYPFTSDKITYDEHGLPKYDRAVDSAFLRKVFAQYFSDGVFYSSANALQVVADTGMQVAVEPGSCHIQGAIGIETNRRTLVVQAAEEMDRIDTVVARLDLSLAVRSIDLYVVKGTAAESPQAPALTRDSTIWELGLANLFVAKNVATISQQRITDTRLDISRCGQVGAPVQPPFDTEAFFSQLEAAIQAHQEDAEAQIEQLRNAIEAVEGDAAWMMKEHYDPAGLGKDITVQTYTHSKSGTVHEFTGTGANGRAKMTADVQVGDTFTVNGTPVTAYMGADNATDAMAGSQWNGKWVSFIVEEGTLNFKGASGGLKPGQLAFVSALEGMNKNTYKTFDTPYFSGKVCQRKCRLTFFTAMGCNIENIKAGFDFKYGVNINGNTVSSVLISDAGADNLVYDLGTFDIEQGDTVEALIVGVGAVNQRGGAIIGVLA